MSDNYHWENEVLKTCRKSKFLGKKTWRNALDLISKKVQGIFGETFILTLLPSAVFRLQNRVLISFNLLCSGEFLKKWGWFQGHNELFPKYLR